MPFLENPRIVWSLCAALLAAAVLFYAWVPLTSDVSYFVLSAERLLAGDRPYVDILETNPPLAFWTTLPPAALAKVLGASPHLLYLVWVAALIALMLALVARLGQGQADRGRTVLAIAAALTLAANDGFGQREHLAALLLMPYLASLMWRADAGGLGVVSGLLAGLALCFKPLFALLPLAAELWRLGHGGRRDIIRVQTISLALPVLLFPVLVWWATPDYYATVVPLALATYGAYQRPLLDLMASPALFSFVLMGGLAMALRGRVPDRGTGLWLAAALAGTAIYAVQGKGWDYQLLPGVTCAAVALLRLALLAPPMLLSRLAVMVAAVLSLSNNFGFVQVQRAILANCDRLFAAGERPKVLLAMTYDNGLMFPFVQERGVVWGSSYPALWMLPAVAKGQLGGAAATGIVEFAAKRVAADLARFRPDQVVVDSRSQSRTLGGHRIDYLALFAPVPEFRSAWASYELLRDGGTFQVWRRKVQ